MTKTLSYTVEYYKDGTIDSEATQTVTEKVWINSTQTTLTVKHDQINLVDKYEGFALDYTDPATIPATIENGSVIKVFYATDVIGKDKDDPEKPDNIPDKYQVKVDYNAVNGTVTPDYFYVTLTDKDGNWSETGSYFLTEDDMPTAKANSGYENGKWDVTPKEGYEITKDTVFTITYTAIPTTDPVTPPTTPDPVFTCPEGTVWNEATGMCEVENPAVVPPVVIDDGGDDDLPPVDEETEEVEEIDEEETPEVGGDEEEIVEEETPEVGGKRAWALINLIATVLGAVLAIVLLASKHQKTEEDEENAEEETEYTRRRKWKVISTITAIVSVIVFVLTENMRLPMVLVDKWTLLMVVFFIINAACLYMGRRFHEEDKDDEATQA